MAKSANPRAKSSRTRVKRIDGSPDSMSATAYGRVKDAIKDGTLKPGERIVEAALADQLGISRTPVREALFRLESEGLISHEARRGLIVSHLDPQAIVELYYVRELLEGAAARLTAQYASEAELMMLQDMVDEEENLGGNVPQLAAHNERFHRAMYAASHNRFLLKSLNALRESMLLLGRTTFSSPGRPESALKEHRSIMKAIAKRDADEAERLARLHIQAARRERLRLRATDVD